MLLEAISKAYSGDQMALDRDRLLDTLNREYFNIDSTVLYSEFTLYNALLYVHMYSSVIQ